LSIGYLPIIKIVLYSIHLIREEEKKMTESKYMSAAQAAQLLREPLPTFYRKARGGAYPSQKVKGKLQFPREAIEAHARLLRSQWVAKATFEPSTNSDLWFRCKLGEEIYGSDDEISYELALRWNAINDEIFMSAKKEGEMIGCSTIMPLDESIILKLSEDSIREKDIPLATIHKWTDRQLSAYIPTIAIFSTGNRRMDVERGIYVIRNTIRWAVSLQSRFDIKNWYGIGVTPEGQEILEALGFQEFLSLENGERKAYKLEDLNQGSPMLRQFLTSI
jgi:hypothetical protein